MLATPPPTPACTSTSPSPSPCACLALWPAGCSCVQADLVRTLRSRADLLLEDALRWDEEQQEQQQGGGGPAKLHPLLGQGVPTHAYQAALPRRVLLPWMVRAACCCGAYCFLQDQGRRHVAGLGGVRGDVAGTSRVVWASSLSWLLFDVCLGVLCCCWATCVLGTCAGRAAGVRLPGRGGGPGAGRGAGGGAPARRGEGSHHATGRWWPLPVTVCRH